MALILVVLLYLADATFLAPRPIDVRVDVDDGEYRELMDRYKMEYDIWVLTEDAEHYRWNLRSTKYLFWVSMIVSMSGVAFAFWQFAQANEFDRRSGDRDELEFKTQMASLSFKTRSIASFVLVVSLAYLMIYVRFLYPVQHLPAADQMPSDVPAVTAPPDDQPFTDTLSDGPATDEALDPAAPAAEPEDEGR